VARDERVAGQERAMYLSQRSWGIEYLPQPLSNEPPTPDVPYMWGITASHSQHSNQRACPQRHHSRKEMMAAVAQGMAALSLPGLHQLVKHLRSWVLHGGHPGSVRPHHGTLLLQRSM
jgi:hypothetical protein